MTNSKTDNMTADVPRIPMDPTRRRIVFAGLLISMFSVMCTVMGVATIMGKVLGDLGGLSLYALCAVAGSFGFAVMTPVGGKLCDKLGRRSVLLIGTLIVFISCIGLGLAKTPTVFLIFVVIYPFGLGFYQMVPNIVTGELYEQSKAPRMFSLLTISLALSMIVGGLVSGALYDSHHNVLALAWPGAVALVGGLIVFFAMPKVKLEFQSEKLDVSGIVLLVLFLSALTFSMNCNGFFGGYGSPVIIAAIIVTILSLILFIIVETKAKNPVIPFKLFKNKKYLGTVLVFLFLPSYMAIYMTYTTLQAGAVLGASATMLGMLNMVRTLVILAFSFFAGIWVSRRFETRAWKAGLLSGIPVLVAFLILTRTTPTTPVLVLILVIAITGFSEVFRGSSIVPLAQQQLAPHEMATGTMLLLVATSVSGTITGNIAGAIFNAKWNVPAMIPANLSAALTPEQIGTLSNVYAISNPAAIDSIRAGLSPDMVVVLNQTIQTIILSLNNTINTLYLLTVCLSFLTCVVAVTLLRAKNSNKELNDSEQTAITK